MLKNEAVDDALANLRKVVAEQYGGITHGIVCIIAQEGASIIVCEGEEGLFESEKNLLAMNHALMDWSIKQP